MGFGGAGFQPLPTVAPEREAFRAKWHSSLKPWLIWRFVKLLAYVSPVGFIVCLVLGQLWIALVCFLLMLLLLRSGIHYVAGKIIFPAQNIAKECNSYLQALLLRSGIEDSLVGAKGIEELRRRKSRLLEQFNGDPIKLVTPDGCTLDGAYFPGRTEKDGAADVTGPTVIYFNANMQLFESASAAATVRMYVMKGINVLLFNYRGVGDSDGTLNRDGVIIDGETAIQYVHDYLQVPEDCILCHARSIGGGIANAVAKLHPQVALCNERSFSSLLDVIRIVVHKFFGVFNPESMATDAEKKWSCGHEMRRCGAAIIVWLASAIGWDFRASDHWQHVRGVKWLMYHPRDAVIPLEASLFNAVLKEGQRVDALRMPGEIDGHNRPLSEEEKEWHMGMVAQAFSRHSNSHSDINSVALYNNEGQLSDVASSKGNSLTVSQSEMMTTEYGSCQ
jgi:hypothetical protein